jgi:hypothetical protein
VCLPCLKPSLAGAVTSADRTNPISLRRLRLPCLELSRPVRFTNRFTEQAIDLRFPAPFSPFRGCHPWMRGTVSGLAKRLPRGMGLTRVTRGLRSCPTSGRGVLVVITSARPYTGASTALLPAQALPRTRLLPDLTGGPVLSWVGASDHAVRVDGS